MVIPSEAVQVGQEGQYVFVVKEDKRVEVRPVTIGSTSEGVAIIAKGLAVGEQVVREGQFLLGPESRVDIKDQSGAAEKTTERAKKGRRDRSKRDKAKAEEKRGAVMNISGLFIRRPVTTTLVMIGILIFGTLGYKSLPVSDLPTVDFPTITVNANLPGASAETMASGVATPLEKNFSTIAGLDSMSSTSSLGRTQITLQFSLSRNVDAAAQDVQAMIARSARDLPPNMPTPPSYRKVNPANNSILLLALTSPTLPLSTVDEFAQTILAQRISMVSGVAQVDVIGSQKYAVRIQLDPNQLAARQVGIDDVVAAVLRGNVDLPVGTLNAPTRAYTLVSDAAADQRGSLSADGRHLSQRRGGAHSRHRHGHR